MAGPRSTWLRRLGFDAFDIDVVAGAMQAKAHTYYDDESRPGMASTNSCLSLVHVNSEKKNLF